MQEISPCARPSEQIRLLCRGTVSFVLACPHCGPREVTDFRFGGEVRPGDDGDRPDAATLTRTLYLRANVDGVQREWWQHRSGCGAWFRAERDTGTNRVLRTAAAEVVW